jgi:hypothetical protein
MKMTKKKSAYKEEMIKKIESFVKIHDEIIFAYIFGSFVESETFNDVDVAIYVDENNALAKEIFYEVELSKELEEIIKIPVDVIALNRTPDFILHRASKGKLIKNSEDDIRIDFITAHWKEYWDFKNKIHEHIEEMKAWK